MTGECSQIEKKFGVNCKRLIEWWLQHAANDMPGKPYAQIASCRLRLMPVFSFNGFKPYIIIKMVALHN